jgi:hypothetical protein
MVLIASPRPPPERDVREKTVTAVRSASAPIFPLSAEYPLKLLSRARQYAPRGTFLQRASA